MVRDTYEAILIVSFGGPESRQDVMPFLENVLRGKNVPRERMLEVAEHYYHFGGKSPINEQIRELIVALRHELDRRQIQLPVYWGNRNWHPMLGDAIQQMAADGIRRAIAFVTSAYSSYSGCRQYREDIQRACQAVGSAAPDVDKLRVFYNHPGFINAWAARVGSELESVPPDRSSRACVMYTAHSIPLAMAENCDYQQQLQETASLISAHVGVSDWQLVYQSRSGPPQQKWLEPDVCDAIQGLREQREGDLDLIIAPIGFLSDHLEVLYDLDVEAKSLCERLNVNLLRTPTVGTHPEFVRMIAQLVEERMQANPNRLAIGRYGPNHDVCPPDCCRYSPPRRPGQSPT